MPKNAVQRLQKIDYELKTVLSIYDIANGSNGNNDKHKTKKDPEGPNFSKMDTSKCWDSILLFDNFRDKSKESPSLLLDPNRTTFNFPFPHLAPSSDAVIARKKFYMLKKPSYSPSSTTLFTIREAEPKTSTETLSDTLEWLDSSSCPENLDVYMSPSKTLLTATEILAQNNYQSEKNPGKSEIEKENLKFNESTKKDPEKVPTMETCDCAPKIKAEGSPAEDQAKSKIIFQGNQLLLPIPIGAKSHRLHKHDLRLPNKTIPTRMERHSRKEKTISEHSPPVPTKVQKLEKSDVKEFKVRPEFRSQTKESIERLEKGWKNSTVEEKHCRGKADNSSGDRRERKSRSPAEKDKKSQIPAYCYAQKARKSPERKSPELRATELTKIIEKSNEKMEKMKASKELALDIAKTLKVKYDNIQQSKDELLEKLQNSEKNNKMLRQITVAAQESQAKLEMKIESISKTSKTKLQEEEEKTKEILEENARLKAKIVELEKDLEKKLLQKQNEIDQLQKERHLERKNDLMNRESLSSDIEKLIEEKAELTAKIEELRSAMKERQSKTESLEDEILQLQEEIKRQQQHINKKTEKLEETNMELESIRNNSQDLEDQVKTLRKNIEHLDDLHKNQLKDHEYQMQLNREETQALQDEKTRLTTELEHERDSLLIKTKIIEDQQETIKQLKEKAEDVKALLKRNQSLERVLHMEREEKLELQDAVERLKWRKEELKSKIKALESDLLLAPQEVVRDLQKTQMVLHELEHQVQIKQKEWELHSQVLLREKEQACRVAEFATRKLMQSTIEFKRQSEAQKKLHRILAENLAERERHLRDVERQ